MCACLSLCASHWVSFLLSCCCIPLSIIIPDLKVPFWAIVYVPLCATLATTLFTPNGITHCISYVLFENSLSIVRLGAPLPFAAFLIRKRNDLERRCVALAPGAVLSGLFNLSDAHQWGSRKALCVLFWPWVCLARLRAVEG